MEELTLLNHLSFWIFAILMVGGALGVVFHRSIVYSALFLLTTFLAIAGFFVLLNAPFIAAAQVLVYGVGLTIVLIFGIMLTGDKPIVDPVGQERPKRFWIIPGIVAAGFMTFLLWALLSPNAELTAINGLFIERVQPNAAASSLAGVQAILADGGLTHIGQLLFSTYLVPFELSSVLLLLAMIGAIILSKRQFPEEEGVAPLEAEKISLGFEQDGSDDLSVPSLAGKSSDGSEQKEVLGVH